MITDNWKSTDTPLPQELKVDNGIYSCRRGCRKLGAWDWLKDISELSGNNELVEVQFKNTRKAIFHNSGNIKLEKDDIVAVEASPGHDIGTVTLVGEIVQYKLQLEGIKLSLPELKKVYRKAKSTDIEKWQEAMDMEVLTMLKARKIAAELKLDMKIGDVEYQGDKTKAIFYYIADERVDFRELIKILADEFRVRIEMRQIGARQEAGRIGGIGSCGRPLCCSSFITNFVSVTTNAARYQEISLNPQKLAGQCSKLKCCLNYELDAYLDAQEDFPDCSVILETKEGRGTHQKTDVFRRLMWYGLETERGSRLACLSVDQVKEIIDLNKKGTLPDKFMGVEESAMSSMIQYENSVGSESLTRFEDKPSADANNRSGRKKRYRPNYKRRNRNE
jgi:cell fate regulator YaaT (PSP1 superfamily)